MPISTVAMKGRRCRSGVLEELEDAAQHADDGRQAGGDHKATKEAIRPIRTISRSLAPLWINFL